MKERVVVVILLFLFLLSGCSTEVSTTAKVANANALVETAASPTLKESSLAKEDSKLGVIKDGVCIELLSDIDRSPIHTLVFKKKDVTHNQELSFEGEPSYELSANIPVEFYIDKEKNCVVEFSTLNLDSSLTIFIDGYEYHYNIPKVDVEYISLQQELHYFDYQVTLDQIAIYPHAIVLSLSSPNDKEAFQETFLLTKDDETEISPKVSIEENQMLLIYPTEIDSIKKSLLLKIGHKDNYIEQQINY